MFTSLFLDSQSGSFFREISIDLYWQPAVLAAKDLTLKAIYSRSLKSAQSLASGLSDVDLYSEDSGAGKGYADLLARQDIKAVIIAYCVAFLLLC